MLALIIGAVFCAQDSIAFALSTMDVSGSGAALADLRNDNTMSIFSVTPNGSCIQTHFNNGPTETVVGVPQNSDASLNATQLPLICLDKLLPASASPDSLQILSVKALDFTKNGKIDLLVSAAPKTYTPTVDAKQVKNILLLQVGDEYSKYKFTFPKYFSADVDVSSPATRSAAKMNFYAPIVLAETQEPMAAMPIGAGNTSNFVPDLVYASGATTIGVFRNNMANYASTPVSLATCLSDNTKCFTEAPFIDFTTDAAIVDGYMHQKTLAIPFELNLVDVDGDLMPEISVRTNAPCSLATGNSLYAPQYANAKLEYEAVAAFDGVKSYPPYDWLPTESCTFVEFYAYSFVQKKYVPYYEEDGETTTPMRKSFALGPGVGALTYSDINANANIDLTFVVCRGADCAVENSLHILYNKQLVTCSGSNTKPGVCRGKLDMWLRDPQFDLCSAGYIYITNMSTVTALNLYTPGLSIDNGNVKVRVNAGPSTPQNNASLYQRPKISVADYRINRRPSLLVPVVETYASQTGAPDSVYDDVLIFDTTPCSIAGCPEPNKAPLGAAAIFAVAPSANTVSYEAPSAAGPQHGVDQASRKGNYTQGYFVDMNNDGRLAMVFLGVGVTHFFRDVVAYSSKGYYLKANGLDDLCFDSCLRAVPNWGTRYYTTTLPGVSFKYVTSDLSAVPAVGAATQAGDLCMSPFSPPYVLWGIALVAQYVDNFYTGNIFAGDSLQTSRNLWNGIVPNSYVVVSFYPTHSPKSWFIQSYLPNVLRTELIATGVALGILVAFLVIVGILQAIESRRDKRDDEQIARLFSKRA